MTEPRWSSFVSAILLSALVAAPHLFGQDAPAWRSRGRLQVGFEHDNNIKEARDDPIAARSLRMMFNYRGHGRGARASLGLTYQGGYQGYWNHPDENKLINELGATGSYRVHSRLLIGFEGWGRLKIFLNEDVDYSLGNAGGFAEILLPAGFRSRVTFIGESVDYAATSMFDCSGSHITLSLSRPLETWLTLAILAGRQQCTFDRPAFEYNINSHLWLPVDADQKDAMSHLGFRLEANKGLLFNLSYSFERNRSNSYGFSFDRHRIQAILGGRLPAEFMLRVLATLQKKRYTEDLNPFIPLELDTEREESNLVVADLSHDLIGGLTAVLRTAWYDNESPIRTLYYTKFATSLSFEYRF